MSALGHKRDICSAKGHVRFAPNSDRESEFPQTVMSALPPKADMCGATAHVCFGPIADSCTAANYFYPQHLITDPKAIADFQGALDLGRPALITLNRKSVEQRGLLVVIGRRDALILGWRFGPRLFG
jgi:hypothetical protein